MLDYMIYGTDVFVLKVQRNVKTVWMNKQELIDFL